MSLLTYARLGNRVQSAVTARRATDPDPDDPVRGLYVSEEQVDDLLVGVDRGLPASGNARLAELGESFGLDDIDLQILLVSLAPDLDVRFERLYGYLHDDVTRRRASIGLALELLGLSPEDHRARARFSPGSALVGPALIELRETERPFLTRALHVSDRVTQHLLGDDEPPPAVAALRAEVPVVPLPESVEVSRAVAAGVPIVYVREGPRTAGLAAGVAGLAKLGRAVLAADLTRLGKDADVSTVLTELAREAGLLGAGLVAGPIDDVMERDPGALDPLRHAACPVVLIGQRGWDGAWLSSTPATVTAGMPDHGVRLAMWEHIAPPDAGFDPTAATAQFRLKPEQAARAWEAAERQAVASGELMSEEHLHAGIRLQNTGRLDHLARRVEPQARSGDLVLPPRVMSLLEEIVQRARHRDLVLDTWQMGGRVRRGRGITALFSGDSGTGKTLSAEVIAHELGLDLYTIDLSTVVDKYIGETEKNLNRIFDQAEDVNAVLFFDEADALFGKRSEVNDARDRYANVEIAYLLQRMELFDGITVLATNFRANLDEAFTRRIDVLIEFPSPEEADRRRLWDLHLPQELPRDGELDLDFLARAFELSGGDIRNVTLSAAYTAATNGGRVTTAGLVSATAREYRKLGRLITTSEFGPYHGSVTEKRQPQGGRDADA